MVERILRILQVFYLYEKDFFFQAEDGIRDGRVTGVQTCALPIYVLAQTSTGNIVFNGQYLPNGSYRLKDYSGVVEVRFSPADSFDLSATSLKGKVNNEAKLEPSHHGFLPRIGNSLVGALNAGRARVEVTSFNGTINILKRN